MITQKHPKDDYDKLCPSQSYIAEPIKPWKWKTDYGTAVVVASKKQRQDALTLIEERAGRGLLIDTETTGLERRRHLRLLLCHNAPFDMISLANWQYGDKNTQAIYAWMIDKALKGEVRDTMVADQILSSEPRSRSLAYLAAQEGVPNLYEDYWHDNAEKLGYSSENKYAAVSPNNKFWLRYSAHDIFQLAAVYRRVVKAGALEEPLVADTTLCAVLYEILRHRGMCLHFGKAGELYRELSMLKNEALKELKSHGIRLPNSSVQVARALKAAAATLIEATPTGKPKIDKRVLEGLKKKGKKLVRKMAGKVLTARSLVKDMGSISYLADNSDGTRVYPTLRTIGAKAGRSSCSTPNLQQLNKHEGDARVRSLLMADYREVIGAMDFDGMELRVVADLAGDKRLRKKLMTGADIHGEVALEIYGTSYTPRDRNKAKIGVFSMLYGASDSSIARSPVRQRRKPRPSGSRGATSTPQPVGPSMLGPRRPN